MEVLFLYFIHIEEEFDETTMTDAKLPGLPQHIATPPVLSFNLV